VITKGKPNVDAGNLAQTGPETTVLSIIGSLFLMAGLAMRYGSNRPAFAAGNQADVAEVLQGRTRNTCGN